MIVWTREDHEQAHFEGWSIYGRGIGVAAWCAHDGHILQIEGNSSLSSETEENQRWIEHVAKRADEGSPLHQKALAFIAQQRLLT